MSYKLRVPSGGYVDIGLPTRTGRRFVFEFELTSENINSRIHFLSSLGANSNHRFYFRKESNSNSVGVFVNNFGTTNTTFDPGDAWVIGTNVVEIFIEFTTSSPYKIIVNGVSSGLSNAVSVFGNEYNTFTAFGFFSAQYSSSISGLNAVVDVGNIKAYLWSSSNDTTGNLVYNYDPSASSGTGLTLYDTKGTQDGTLIGFAGDDSQWIADEGTQDESDSWAFAATANITFGGIKHSSDSLALAQTAELNWAASKSASDALNVDVNALVSANGTKQTSDNIQLPTIAAISIDGIKHTAADIHITATGDISLNGIKHSSDALQITAYAVVDWVGSSEVTRTGSITIEVVAGITFGGIKHSSDSLALGQTASANVNGTKTTADGWASHHAANAELNGVKDTGGDWVWQATASVSMAGYSSQAATHSMSIKMSGVLQSVHLTGVVRTTNIKGYI